MPFISTLLCSLTSRCSDPHRSLSSIMVRVQSRSHLDFYASSGVNQHFFLSTLSGSVTNEGGRSKRIVRVRNCLLIVGIIFSWCLAEAKNRINDVLFEPGEDTASFLLVTSEPVSPEQVEKLADGDPSVVMVRFSNLRVSRKWVSVKDKMVKRALVHPSKEKSGASVLRIRFFDKRVDTAFIDSIRIVAEDAGLRVDLPRDIKSKPAQTTPPQALNIDVLDKAIASSTNGKPTPPASSLTQAPSSAKTPSTSTDEAPTQPKPSVSTAESNANISSSLNPLPIKPEGTKPPDAPSATPAKVDENKAGPAVDPLAPKSKNEPTSEQAGDGLVFMPGVRTRDIVAGFTDMTLRLEKGMRERPGVRRIVVFPFLELDPTVKGTGLGDVSRALLADRLVRRSGIISADQKMLEDTIRELPTDDMGRFAIDEARAAGFVVGADTLLIGTISTTGNGYFVDARAVDVNTGDRLVEASQEFEAVKFNEYANIVREERTS